MRKKNSKEQLLRAALKIVSEKGYVAATTRDIAREAGVSELTLFRHFGSKERLFEKLLEGYTFLPRLRGLLPELKHLPPERALILVATEFLETLKERKPLIQVLHSEIRNYPENVRKVFNNFMHEMQATLSSYFQTLQAQGVLSQDVSANMASRMFLWVLFSYFRSVEIMSHAGPKKKDLAEIVKIFSHGLLREEN